MTESCLRASESRGRGSLGGSSLGGVQIFPVPSVPCFWPLRPKHSGPLPGGDRQHVLGMRLHPPVASESQDMMPEASRLGFFWGGGRDKGQQVSMDLKSKLCPMGEFSTSYPRRLLLTSAALYYPKETSLQSVVLSSEGLERAVPVVAIVGAERAEVPEEAKGFACRSGPLWLANP